MDMSRSTQLKEAFKVGLAMAVAYGIALQLEWESPFWAGLSVAFCSTATFGQSLNQGVTRVGGTILACAAALFMLGLFPQDRWALFALFSAYTGVLTYLMTGPTLQNFWFNGVYCAAIILISGQSSENTFNHAMGRTEETILGVVVYTLIAVFLWPRTNAGTLKDVSNKLLATQAQLFRALRERMVHAEVAADVHKLSQGQVTLLDQLQTAFEGGKSESYDVYEVRGLWAQLHGLSSDLMMALERWRESFADIAHLDTAKVIPDLPPYFDELDRRFLEIERMLGGNPPQAEPKAVTVTASKTELHALSQFERAAVIETRRALERVEALTGAIFACVRDLKGFGSTTTRPVPAPPAERTADPLWLPIFDPDRIRAAVMAMVSVWVIYLLWVYLNPPGHQGLIALGIAMTTIFCRAPFVRPTLLLRAFAIWMPFGLAVYVFVLPHLSSFLGLGLVIFAFTFVVAYFLKGLDRVAGMLALLLMIDIDNQQTYDFASQANSYLWALLSVAVPVATSAITFSLQPEKAFLNLINRFFGSSEFIVSRTAWETRPSNSLVERWKLAYHRQELRTLPKKLGTWGHFIDHKLFPNNTPEQVQALVTSLQVLVYRLQALTEARRTPQADLLVQGVLDDLRAWHIVLQEGFHRLTESPGTAPARELKGLLATQLADLEKRISETLNQADAGALTEDNYENFYGLLGGYRGVSEAAVAYAGVAEKVNWAEWREARF